MKRWVRWMVAVAVLSGAMPPCVAEEIPTVSGSEGERTPIFYADRILDHLEGRDWLVTDGFIDDVVLRRAAERKLAVTVVPLMTAPGTTNAWRGAVTALNDERLALAAELGALTFVREWLRADPQTASKRVATMVLPDLWASVGLAAVPNGLVFLGASDTATAAAGLEERLVRHQVLWDELGELFVDSGRTSTARISETRLRLRRQCALVANNLGVLLQRAGKDRDAFDTYTRARLIDPQNISALLNRAVCVKRGVRPELSEQIGQELEGLRQNSPNPLVLWSLTQLFGTVENPEDFIALGWNWALSGVPATEKERWTAALEKVAEDQRDAVRRQLESTHAGQVGGGDGDLRLLDALRDEKQRGEALVILSRRAVGQGQMDAAEAWLAKAEAAGVPAVALTAERAALLTARGKTTEARALLEKAIAEKPDAWQLFALLTTLLAELKDVEALEATLPKLAAAPGVDPYHVLVAKGRLYALKGQAWPARDAFLRALEKKPEALLLYDLILPLDFALADKRAAEQHADTVLKLLPNHAFANYIKGTLFLERKNYTEAEAFFRRSLNAAVSLPALNDYAMLLVETRRPEEAERVARDALKIDPKEPAVWDTLATALTALERHDEAYEALEKATTAAGEDPRILLHWAQALHRRGDKARAKEAAEKVHTKRMDLEPLERDALLKLRDALSVDH